MRIILFLIAIWQPRSWQVSSPIHGALNILENYPENHVDADGSAQTVLPVGMRIRHDVIHDGEIEDPINGKMIKENETKEKKRTKREKGKNKKKRSKKKGRNKKKRRNEEGSAASSSTTSLCFPRCGTVREAMLKWADFEAIRSQFPQKIPGYSCHARDEYRRYYRVVERLHNSYNKIEKDEFDEKFGNILLVPHTLSTFNRISQLLDDSDAKKPKFPQCNTLGEAMKRREEFEAIKEKRKQYKIHRSDVYIYYTPISIFQPIYDRLGEEEFNRQLGQTKLRPYRASLKSLKELAAQKKKELGIIVQESRASRSKTLRRPKHPKYSEFLEYKGNTECWDQPSIATETVPNSGDGGDANHPTFLEQLGLQLQESPLHEAEYFEEYSDGEQFTFPNYGDTEEHFAFPNYGDTEEQFVFPERSDCQDQLSSPPSTEGPGCYDETDQQFNPTLLYLQNPAQPCYSTESPSQPPMEELVVDTQNVEFRRYDTVGEAIEEWATIQAARARLPEKIPRNHKKMYEVRVIYSPIAAFHNLFQAMDGESFYNEFGKLPLLPYTHERASELIKIADKRAVELGILGLRAPPKVALFPHCNTLGEAMTRWKDFETGYKQLPKQPSSWDDSQRHQYTTYYRTVAAFRPLFESLGEEQFAAQFGRLELKPYRTQSSALKELAKEKIKDLLPAKQRS